MSSRGGRSALGSMAANLHQMIPLSTNQHPLAFVQTNAVKCHNDKLVSMDNTLYLLSYSHPKLYDEIHLDKNVCGLYSPIKHAPLFFVNMPTIVSILPRYG